MIISNQVFQFHHLYLLLFICVQMLEMKAVFVSVLSRLPSLPNCLDYFYILYL